MHILSLYSLLKSYLLSSIYTYMIIITSFVFSRINRHISFLKNDNISSLPPPTPFLCVEPDDYLATTRDGFSRGSGRDIGMARSLPGEFAWSTAHAPALVEQGTVQQSTFVLRRGITYHGTVWWSKLRCGSVQHSVVWYGTSPNLAKQGMVQQLSSCGVVIPYQ